MKIINFIKEIILFSKEKNNKKIISIFLLILLISIVNSFLFIDKKIGLIEVVIFLTLFIFFLKLYKETGKESFNNVIKYTELKAVIQNIDDGVIVYDTNFKIVDFNHAAEKIFNLKEEEIINKTITPRDISSEKLKILVQTIFPSLAPSINTISDSGWPKIVEINFDEPHLKLRTFLNQVIDEKGKVVAFIKIVSDKTREYDILESKSEFLTVSAHQLRTPLTALSWTIESLRKILSEKTNFDKEALNLTEEAWNLIQRSLKIIEDLLNAAKIEEGRFDFNFKNTDLVKLLTRIKELVLPIASEFGIKLDLDIKVSEARIFADEEKLGMAITNIIENGIKYNTPNGSVTVTLENYVSDKNYFKVSISDTGIGIPKESLNKMFQKFYRAENAQRVEPNGNGLGLYISRNIIEKHRGKIFVESELQRGSTFWFIIPKAELINLNPNYGGAQSLETDKN